MTIKYDREVIMIRNVPIDTREVIAVQQEHGAQLFDESIFHDPSKKVACAQVIHHLDTEYAKYEHVHGRPPIQLYIGDGAWVYIPVQMFPQENIISVRTKNKPAGMVAWFRKKKIYAVKPSRNSRFN